MERNLLEGKTNQEVEFNGKKYTALQLGVKKGADLIECLGEVISHGTKRLKEEEDLDKNMVSFILGLLPELIVKFVDQMCRSINKSVIKESGEYLTIEEAEELSFDQMAELAGAVILANADQIERTITHVKGDLKKKILEAFPETKKYLIPEVPKKKQEVNSTQMLFTESSNGE